MASTFFSFEPFDYGRDHVLVPVHEGYEKNGGMKKGQSFLSEEDWGDFDVICSQHVSGQDNIIPLKGVFLSDEPQLEAETISEFGILDDFQFNMVSPQPFFQVPVEAASLDSVLREFSDFIQPPKNKKPYPSLDLLNGYKSGHHNKMNGEKLLNEQYLEPPRLPDGYQRLSTEEVMRVAGAQYIQFSVPKDENLSLLSHPFGVAFSGLTDEETKDVELAHLLLASAEKIGNQHFERGSRLLTQCAYLSSNTGSPVQRITYYFAEALRERINRETGRCPSYEHPTDTSGVSVAVMEEAMRNLNSTILACHQLIPFSQLLQFPGVQAIVESVSTAKKVHLIDLALKTGIPWTVLMQALAGRQECQIEMLKITAVATKSEEQIQETGKRLASFAESMGLPFSFKVVIVSNVEDIKEDMLEAKEEEAVVIYSSFVLRTMLTETDRLDTLMRVIRNLNPCIMVVTEVEANHNSPSFFNRFIESLFYYSAFFDCLDACMDRNNQNRMTMEVLYFGQAITNIVATEGEERTFRHVGIDVWRAFFARFGMVETEFSHSSIYQANLVGKQFACGKFCNIEMNGKCIIVGWKGTPLHSLSAWKFH